MLYLQQLTRKDVGYALLPLRNGWVCRNLAMCTSIKLP